MCVQCNIVKEGFLDKRSPSKFKGWQQRYFVLTKDLSLQYAPIRGLRLVQFTDGWRD